VLVFFVIWFWGLDLLLLFGLEDVDDKSFVLKSEGNQNHKHPCWIFVNLALDVGNLRHYFVDIYSIPIPIPIPMSKVNRIE